MASVRKGQSRTIDAIVASVLILIAMGALQPIAQFKSTELREQQVHALEPLLSKALFLLASDNTLQRDIYNQDQFSLKNSLQSLLVGVNFKLSVYSATSGGLELVMDVTSGTVDIAASSTSTYVYTGYQGLASSALLVTLSASY